MTDIPKKIRTDILPLLKPSGVRDQIVAGHLDGIGWAVAIDANGDITEEFAMAMTERDFEKLEAGFRAVGAVYEMQQAQAALANMTPPTKTIN